LWDRRVLWWNTDFSGDDWKPEIVHCMSNRYLQNLNPDDPLNPVSWKDKNDEFLRERDKILQLQKEKEIALEVELKRAKEMEEIEKRRKIFRSKTEEKSL